MAGGLDVALSAKGPGPADSFIWTLDGPGSLSQNSGSSIQYSPPACARAVAIATVTATSPSDTATVTLEV